MAIKDAAISTLLDEVEPSGVPNAFRRFGGAQGAEPNKSTQPGAQHLAQRQDRSRLGLCYNAWTMPLAA